MTLLYLIGRKIKKMMSPNNVKAVFLESSWPWLFLYHQMTQVFHPIMEFVLDWSFVFLGWHWCNGVSRKSILCHPILQNDRYQVLFVNVTRTSADFSAICDLIWLPFGVWQAVTKPWSDTKGHPNRCSSSREILFQTWDSEEVVILWWFFPTFLCNSQIKDKFCHFSIKVMLWINDKTWNFLNNFKHDWGNKSYGWTFYPVSIWHGVKNKCIPRKPVSPPLVCNWNQHSAGHGCFFCWLNTW